MHKIAGPSDGHAIRAIVLSHDFPPIANLAVSLLTAFRLKTCTLQHAWIHEVAAVRPHDALDAVLVRVDAIVGAAFGFTADEVDWMRGDLRTDPLFRQLVHPLPFAARTLRGELATRARHDRYETVRPTGRARRQRPS